MYVLVPLDCEIKEDAKLTKLADVKIWAQLNIENGELADISFSSEWDKFDNLSEAVIVADDNEYVWPFMEYNMMVLVAHTQQYIDDIVEAFLFKELHDLAY